MNQCHFYGNLTRDPELREFNSGSKKVVFTLAVERYYKRKDNSGGKETSFLSFEAWDSAAELISERLRKGDPILIIDASARNDNWEDSEGKKRSRVFFRVNEFRFTNGRPSADDQAPQGAEQEPAAVGAGAGSDDEIPF